MRYLSVCSGIEAATAAWHHMGWQPAAFSEIEPFPSAVLAHHYPNVPNVGDMTKYEDWNVGQIGLLVGGTPCQAFSVAGLRGGLSDARGNLSLVFCKMADHFDPEFVLWENVPGVLSSTDNAFGCFLAGLSGASEPISPGRKWSNAGVVSGPKRTVAWRVLDAQFFGVAQRRRRVFVLAVRGAGNWAACAALFPVSEGEFWNSAPSRKAREVAPTIPARSLGGGGLGTDFDCDGGLIARGVDLQNASLTGNLAGTLDAEGQSRGNRGQGVAHQVRPQWWDGGDLAATITTKSDDQRMPDKANAQLVVDVTHSLRGEGFDASEDGTGRGTPLVPVAQPYTLALSGRDGVPTLETRQDGTANALLTPNGGRGGIGVGAIAFHPTQDPIHSADVCHSLGANDNATAAVAVDTYNHTVTGDYTGSLTTTGGPPLSGPGVLQAMQVRRLTPVECERLQGFPDNFTAIPWRKPDAADCPDGPRYKALGNSMAVPVMRWIGERIQGVQQ